MDSLEPTKRADLVACVQDAVEIVTDHLGSIMDELAAMITEICDWFSTELDPFVGLAKFIADSYDYRIVATGREWHLYLHGKRRVQKKWENEFRRRLRKKGGGDSR